MQPLGGDATQRFGSRVAAYARARPSYPEALLDELQRRGLLAPERLVLELGAGTGILTRLLLARGARVHALEPNAAMRAELERALAPAPAGARAASRLGALAIGPGTAEASGMPAACAGLVIGAQAFHWFDPRASALEIRRVLAPGGWVAAVWNERDEQSAFDPAYEALVRRHELDYGEVSDPERKLAPLRALYGELEPPQLFRHVQRLDREGLAERLLSCSYLPGRGDPRSAPMLAEASALFDAHARAGAVELAYACELYLGQPRA